MTALRRTKLRHRIVRAAAAGQVLLRWDRGVWEVFDGGPDLSQTGRTQVASLLIEHGLARSVEAHTRHVRQWMLKLTDDGRTVLGEWDDAMQSASTGPWKREFDDAR